jgi:hypothetical protein
MKVKLSAFSITLHDELTVTEFIQSLKRLEGTRKRISLHERVIRIGETRKYILGRIDTDRGMKKFTQMNQETDRVTVGGLPNGNTFSGFNFFIIAKQSLCGILAHYSESAGLSFLWNLFERAGLNELHRKMTSEINAADDEEEEDEIKEKYEGTAVEGAIIANNRQARAILATWEQIKELELVYKTPAEFPNYFPQDPTVKWRSERIVFHRSVEKPSLIRRIFQLTNDQQHNRASAMRIIGKNELGSDDRIDLAGSIPVTLNELEYDDVVGEADLFHNDLGQSPLIQLMIQEANQRPAIFN